ncbi:MAG: OmpA family protein [Bacteroidales bacterium]|nr:OmpA family protein [Bacteroidales bacterium]
MIKNLKLILFQILLFTFNNCFSQQNLIENFVKNNFLKSSQNNCILKNDTLFIENYLSSIKIATFYNKIDSTENFTISADIQQINGEKNIGHGIVWAGKGINNCNIFLISNNGYFCIGKNQNNKFSPILNWQKTTAINTSSKNQKLEITHTQTYTLYKINNKIVYTSSRTHIFGNEYGFAVRKGIKMASSYFNITKITNNNLSSKQTLKSNINTKYAEIAPIESYDGQKLYFARTFNSDNIGDENDCDIWMSTKQKSGEWSKAINIQRPLNNEFTNVVFCADSNALYIEGVYNKDGSHKTDFGISKTTQKEDGSWNIPQQIMIKDFYNKNFHASYTFNPDKSVLIMSVERNDSYGNLDLYVSFKNSNNTYSTPQNLGPIINTKLEDGTPFIASDNRTLYFSSYGHNSMGSSDIFMSRRTDDTWQNWTEPINLGPEINTPFWDAYFYISNDGKRYYSVSSNELGNENIYTFELPEELKPLKNYYVSGVIKDKKTHKPISAEILVIDNKTKNQIVNTKTNKSGYYSLEINNPSEYTIKIWTQNSYPQTYNLDINPNKFDYTLNAELSIFEVGSKVTLNNVYFERSKATINKKSYPELNRLYNFLSKNPNIYIQINGYTEPGIGNLQNLATARTMAVKNYLVKRGINPQRITCKGFGGEKASNKTGDKKRVEFVIIKK